MDCITLACRWKDSFYRGGDDTAKIAKEAAIKLVKEEVAALGGQVEDQAAPERRTSSSSEADRPGILEQIKKKICLEKQQVGVFKTFLP